MSAIVTDWSIQLRPWMWLTLAASGMAMSICILVLVLTQPTADDFLVENCFRVLRGALVRRDVAESYCTELYGAGGDASVLRGV